MNAALDYLRSRGAPRVVLSTADRKATRQQFETYWGRALGANVVYVNGAKLAEPYLTPGTPTFSCDKSSDQDSTKRTIYDGGRHDDGFLTRAA